MSLTVCFSVDSTVVCMRATRLPEIPGLEPENTQVGCPPCTKTSSRSRTGSPTQAATIAMDRFADEGLEIRHKADRTLVTAADTAIERMVARTTRDGRSPSDRIMGEEEGGTFEGAGRVWIVDPIDGTANFARRGRRLHRPHPIRSSRAGATQRPLEPKPPSPRADSASASTSTGSVATPA